MGVNSGPVGCEKKGTIIDQHFRASLGLPRDRGSFDGTGIGQLTFLAPTTLDGAAVGDGGLRVDHLPMVYVGPSQQMLRAKG